MLEEVMKWANVIRDVGLILGIPTIVIVGMKLYGLQINALKQQNELLKETQYDRALSLLKGQKELFEMERQDLENQVESLQARGEGVDQEVNILREKLERVNQGISNFSRSINDLEVNFYQSSFQNDAIFRQSKFNGRVDFYQTYLSGNVNFIESLFKGTVDFSGSVFEGIVGFRQVKFHSPPDFTEAKMSGAIFTKTDLRGADLSKAIVDKHTRLPTAKN